MGFFLNPVKLGMTLFFATVGAALVVGIIAYCTSIQSTARFTFGTIRLTGQGYGILIPAISEGPKGYQEAKKIAKTQRYDAKTGKYVDSGSKPAKP
jgi:hypothetical protein